MKTIGRFLALTLSVTVLAAVPTLAQAAPAETDQRAMRFSTIKTWSGAKQQACKQATPNGKSWKVLTRVVNGKKAEVGVGLQVVRDGQIIDDFQTPIVKKGATSKTGSVKIRKGDKTLSLMAFQFQAGMGDGSPVTLKSVRRC